MQKSSSIRKRFADGVLNSISTPRICLPFVLNASYYQ